MPVGTASMGSLARVGLGQRVEAVEEARRAVGVLRGDAVAAGVRDHGQAVRVESQIKGIGEADVVERLQRPTQVFGREGLLRQRGISFRERRGEIKRPQVARAEAAHVERVAVWPHLHERHAGQVARVARAGQAGDQPSNFTVACDKRHARAVVARARALFGHEQRAIRQRCQAHGAQ